MKQKRANKLLNQLILEAYTGQLSVKKPLYVKEARRLRGLGLTVERAYSKEFDHPERNSFLYVISWNDVEDKSSFAQVLNNIVNDLDT